MKCMKTSTLITEIRVSAFINSKNHHSKHDYLHFIAFYWEIIIIIIIASTNDTARNANKKFHR